MPGEALVGELGGAVRTLKHCPPLIDAMRAGLPDAARGRRPGRGRRASSWDWDLPATALGRTTRSPLSFHHAEQALGSPLHDPERVFVKFNSFWTIALEPGWSLLAMHPVNRGRPAVRDADRAGRRRSLRRRPDPLPRPLARSGFEGVLARGTPVAQCLPVRREALALAFEPLAGDGGGSASPRSRTRSPPSPASTASATAPRSPEPRARRAAGSGSRSARPAARSGAARGRTTGPAVGIDDVEVEAQVHRRVDAAAVEADPIERLVLLHGLLEAVGPREPAEGLRLVERQAVAVDARPASGVVRSSRSKPHQRHGPRLITTLTTREREKAARGRDQLAAVAVVGRPPARPARRR